MNIQNKQKFCINIVGKKVTQLKCVEENLTRHFSEKMFNMKSMFNINYYQVSANPCFVVLHL